MNSAVSAPNQKLFFRKLFSVTPGVNENRYLPSPQTSSCQEPTIQPTYAPSRARLAPDPHPLGTTTAPVLPWQSIIWFARPWFGPGSSSSSFNKRRECQEDQFKSIFLNALSQTFPSRSSWSLASNRIKIFKFFSHEMKKNLLLKNGEKKSLNFWFIFYDRLSLLKPKAEIRGQTDKRFP